MFTSKPDYYWSNMADAQNAHARPALLTNTDGSAEPAVAIFNEKRLKFLLPTSEALRLANQIANTLETNRNTTP
jgi:hypothetical protein